jgi:hypothetical protein
MVALLGGLVLAQPTFAASDAPDSQEVANLLSQAKRQAFQLREDASTMESFTRLNATWESHAATIAEIRGHVNDAIGTLSKLESSRKGASAWQMTAIERIRPLIKEIASNTEAVIQYLNKNPKGLAKTEYKDYIEANEYVSQKLAGLIADFVDYGKTKNRLDRLSARLELP